MVKFFKILSLLFANLKIFMYIRSTVKPKLISMHKSLPICTMLLLLASCASSEIDDINPTSERCANPHRVSLSQALNTAEQMFSSFSSDKPTVRSGRSVASVSYMVEPAVRNTESIDTALYIVNYKGEGLHFWLPTTDLTMSTPFLTKAHSV